MLRSLMTMAGLFTCVTCEQYVFRLRSERLKSKSLANPHLTGITLRY
ncbi:hypothetical protein GA0061103_1506 [Rhizobium multihospitium]|uniref:Uncharacterized protein n=1 Tax=Rhizobium multihospitium TaxID=410764 RepID=A0A1C3U4R2_9HYPH|nr:hypothetical protein GA0061103_1506 [Rhizobium multihospitium]